MREENTKSNRLVADLSLDRHMLQEIVRKKLEGLGSGAGWRGGHKLPMGSASAGRRG